MQFDNVFPLAFFALTSSIFMLVGARRLGLKLGLLSVAVREILECAGAALIFLAINVTIGVLAVSLIRAFFRFLPLYALTDTLFVLLAVIQGIVFQRWWRKSRA